MEAKLMEANPLVEENRNQVAVKRGPVVYCLESVGLSKNNSVFGLALPVNTKFTIVPMQIGNSNVMALQSNAKQIENDNWKGQLYKEVNKKEAASVPLRLIPYYAWGNR